MTQPTVTIADIAREAGVSLMTVSRALNDRERVAEGTRQRVLETAERLGYVANFAARGLRGGRTNVLGMVLHDLSSQFLTEIVAGASEAAQEAGFELLLHVTLSSDPARERARIASLSSGLADGLLIVLPRNSEDFLRSLERNRTPVVLINHRGLHTNLLVVGADNRLGARHATQHLVDLGHQRIGFIAGDPLSGQSPERLMGYREVLGAAGLGHDETLVRPGDFTQPRGRVAATELLDLPVPPTAIFAANDLTAFGVIEAVRQRGLRVPDDVSVVGFDDIPMASQLLPALTTVRHPLRELGRVAVRQTLGLIEGETMRERQLELPSELIVRSSTAPPS